MNHTPLTLLRTITFLDSNTTAAEPLSLFANHSLTPIYSGPIANTISHDYWPAVVVFFVFSILVGIKITDPKKIPKIVVSTFSLQVSKQLYREDYRPNKRVSLLLSLCFALTLAFLMYRINDYFNLILKESLSLNQYVFFVSLVFIIYLLKILVNYLLAYVFNAEELFREYVFSVLVFGQTTGILLFPFIICLQFTKYPSEWFLYPALVVYAVFYFLRLFRGFIISLVEQNVGILYIFLYLCGLEIVPFLVLIKCLLVNF